MSNSLWPHGLYSPWNSPGQNTGVGSLSLLQQIFPTQESNLGLLHCRWILYQQSYQGSPHTKPILQQSAEYLIYYIECYTKIRASLVAQMVKNPPAVQETWIQSLGCEDCPGGGHGNSLQYSYLENLRGPRCLVGYSQWDYKESNTMEQLNTSGWSPVGLLWVFYHCLAVFLSQNCFGG